MTDNISKYQLDINNISLELNENKIFDNLNIRCDYSNIVVIKGAVGSGKSTLLKMMSGVVSQSAGTISNINISTQDSVECIYIHSQAEFNFITGYVKDELKFAGIDEAEFQNVLNRSVYDLSGGELKKISLIMAMNTHKDCVILLDEPLDMLDDVQADNMVSLIVEKSKAIPFIISTHDSHFDKVADFIIQL